MLVHSHGTVILSGKSAFLPVIVDRNIYVPYKYMQTSVFQIYPCIAKFRGIADSGWLDMTMGTFLQKSTTRPPAELFKAKESAPQASPTFYSYRRQGQPRVIPAFHRKIVGMSMCYCLPPFDLTMRQICLTLFLSDKPHLPDVVECNSEILSR